LPRVKTTERSDSAGIQAAGGGPAGSVGHADGGGSASEPRGSGGEPRGLSLSVVIPVYNEEENLDRLHGQLHAVLSRLGVSYEILFVDDGSEDASAEILHKLSSIDSHVRVITFESNAGQSSAFDAGFARARGDNVVTLDADLQNDPADIPKVLDAMSRCDVVCGWRVKRNDPWIKRLSSRIANGVRNALSQETIRDTGCSLKGFRREHLARLKLYDGMHRFLPTLLKMEGCSVIEIPVNHLPRFAGKSKYGIRNRVFRSFRDLLAVRWMKARRLRYRIKSEEGGES
jgi:glycosyltransferase involved in cell wall biosynthesis